MTNDSPFGLLPFKQILLHDGRVKNKFGLTGLDLYPKQLPNLPGLGADQLTDFPFQSDYFTKLYAEFNTIYTKDTAHRFAYGAEMQGGFFALPIVGQLTDVAPEATDQLMARTIGHGLKSGSIYVLRGGLNIDNSAYDFQSAIGLDGEERPRWDVLKKWTRFLTQNGAALQDMVEVEDPIAILQDVSYAVPQAGTNDDMQDVYYKEYPGIYGWMINSNFNPAVVEAKLDPDLSKYRVVVAMVPKIIDPATAAKLRAFHDAGGVLVQLLDPGTSALDGSFPDEVQSLSQLFPADVKATNHFLDLPGNLIKGRVNLILPGPEQGIWAYWYRTTFEPQGGADLTPLLRDRNFFGTVGALVGFETSAGGATRALLGTHIESAYALDEYYEFTSAELGEQRALAQHLAGLGGLTPTLATDGPRELVWARKARGDNPRVLVFVVNDHEEGTIHVHFNQLAPLGMRPDGKYAVVEALSGASLGTLDGATLNQNGLSLDMAKFGTAVLSITPQ
jgi:hypothetical protein